MVRVFLRSHFDEILDGYFFQTCFWQMGYEGTKLNGILVKKVVFDRKRLKDILLHSRITLQWSELGLNDEGEKRWYFV
jgi:hypothetical protein